MEPSAGEGVEHENKRLCSCGERQKYMPSLQYICMKGNTVRIHFFRILEINPMFIQESKEHLFKKSS